MPCSLHDLRWLGRGLRALIYDLHHNRDDQVQTRGAVLLAVTGPFSDPPLPEGADGLRQRMSRTGAQASSILRARMLPYASRSDHTV
jgi:hypothetical protein